MSGTKSKTKVMDMTVGSPAMHILIFSIPLLIGNLFQQLYNMVDSLIVGNYVGANALAAVGTCGSVNFLFFSLGNGIATGIGIIVAQFFGARDENSIRNSIANSVYILTAISIVAGLTGFLISTPLLRMLNTPDTLLRDASIYMKTTCLGMIFICLYNGVAAILRALGDSRTPLYFLILASIVNVVLDLLFVLGFHWGGFGVALATVISQAVSAVTSMVYAYIRMPYFRLTAEQLKPNRFIIEKSIRLGLPIALQNSMIAISCIALQGIINSFGETVMATSTIIGRIEQLVQQPYGSLGAALTTYAGQNIGAGKVDRVKQGFRQSVIIVLVFSLLLLPIFFVFGADIIGLFVKEPEVIAMGTIAIRINSVCYFALGMIYVPRAILNGCGDTGFAMLNGFTEVVGRVGLSPILTRIPFIGYWGIWVTTGATWTLTAIVCVLRYGSGIWKHKKIVIQK